MQGPGAFANPLWCISFSTTLQMREIQRGAGAGSALLSDIFAKIGDADRQVSDVRAAGLARELRVRDTGRLRLLLLLHGEHCGLDLLQVHSLYRSVAGIVRTSILCATPPPIAFD